MPTCSIVLERYSLGHSESVELLTKENSDSREVCCQSFRLSAANCQHASMAHPQLYPLQVNERTGEPFLRLPSPHENIIITPRRLEDVPFIVSALNDPRVYRTLEGPPFPYTEEDAISWLNKTKGAADEIFQELQEAADAGLQDLKFVEGCPVRTLREVREDGTDLFFGRHRVRQMWLPRCRRWRGESAARGCQQPASSRRQRHRLVHWRYDPRSLLVRVIGVALAE